MNTQLNSWNENSTAPQKSPELMKKLPALLRIIGAAALLIAMYSFLAKGWQSGNDLLRYLLMLGHTGALAAIGLASGHWLKEGKSARLLLTLALAAVPANFAILGAFIYSQTTAAAIGNYPHYVAWSVESLQTALLTSSGAMLVLIPVTLLGFTVLARSMSKKLSLLFLLSNAALLLPLRDPQLVGLLALALGLCSIRFSRQAAHLHSAAKTREGVAALGLQLLPLLLLMGRTLWLYSVDMFLLTILSITLFVVLRQISLYMEPGSKLRHLLDSLSLIPAATTGLWLAATLVDTGIAPQPLVLPLVSLTAATMVYDISRRSSTSGATYRRIAVVGLLLGMIANLMLFDTLLATVAGISVGVLLSVRGFKSQQRSLFGGGIALILMSLVQQLYQLLHHFDLGSWASMAALGVSAIVAAAVMESQAGNLKPRLEQWRSRLQQWES